MKTVVFTYNGITIKFNDNKLTNLTDLWKAVGGKSNDKPAFWLRNQESAKLLKTLSKTLKVDNSQLLKIKRGNGGGTYAHWQIATAYAKYLDAELHIEFNNYIKAHIEEVADPELKVTRAVETYKKKYRKEGKSEDWIETRLIGITQRNTFTKTINKIDNLGSHGFGMITDDMNKMLLGHVAKDIKNKLGVTRTRDGLTSSQLMVLSLGEELAVKALNKKGINDISKGEAIDTVLESVEGLSKVAGPLKIK